MGFILTAAKQSMLYANDLIRYGSRYLFADTLYHPIITISVQSCLKALSEIFRQVCV